MPHVTIVTPMRNAEPYLLDYARRIGELAHPPDELRVIAVEGDSVDGTRAMVEAWAAVDARVTVVQCEVGGPHYTSIVHPDRFRQLATVFNAGLDRIDLEWSEWAMLLPVDIDYQPDLLQRLLRWGKSVISPFVYQNGVFYDIWAFSMENEFFGPFPELPDPPPDDVGPIEMTTIGGTMLFRRSVLRAGVRYGLAEVDRDFSRAARAAGFRLWADPTTRVYHRP